MYGVGGLNSGSCRPIGGVTLGRPWLNRDGSHLGRVKQGLRSQVGVTLGHARLGVPKEVLDHVKRHALVHQEAGEGMAQIMQSDVSQAGTAPDAVPWTEQTGELRWEDVGARRISPATCSPVDVKDKSQESAANEGSWKARGQARAGLFPRAAIAKGARLRSEPHDGRELGDRPFRLCGLSRPPRLGDGEPAPQDLVLGLQGLDGG
jgi:hypothetical protein